MISPKNSNPLWYDYFKMEDIPPSITYETLKEARKNEIYLRKFLPTTMENDLNLGIHSAVIIWYDFYIDDLYDISYNKGNWRKYFHKYPRHILETFEILFKRKVKTLDELSNCKEVSNHFGEYLKFRKIR